MGAAWPKDERQPHQDRRARIGGRFNRSSASIRRPCKMQRGCEIPIDAFILARLEKEHLKPSPEADKETLLRRVSLDLTGLLPSPEEIRDFLADTRPDAYERVVDRLLASPHYGERWGRHWLDVARYADSDGYTIDAPRQMWKYRDWVINALNRDMPFDQFVDRADRRRPAAEPDRRSADRHRLPSQHAQQLRRRHRFRTVPRGGGRRPRVHHRRRVSRADARLRALPRSQVRSRSRRRSSTSSSPTSTMWTRLRARRSGTTSTGRFSKVPTPEEIARQEGVSMRSGRRSAKSWSRMCGNWRRVPRKPGDPDPSKDPGLIERVQQPARAAPARAEASPPRWSCASCRSRAKATSIWAAISRARALSVQAGDPGRAAAVAAGRQYAARSREVAGGSAESAHQPRHRQSHVAGVFRQGHRRDGKRFRHAGRRPIASGTARLAGQRIHPPEVEPEGDPPADRHVGDVPAVLEADDRRSRRSIRTTSCWRGRTGCGWKPRSSAMPALAASGLLTATVGGPSVYPPIPEGAMAVTQVSGAWPTATGPDRYRRGLYTFFRRSAAYPGPGGLRRA